MLRFENLNQALIGISRELLTLGKWRQTRGFKCCEYPYPMLIEITNPSDNVITIPERKWAKTLPFAEALWLASGTNHMGLVETYAPNMKSFSDDGEFMRAAYGTRIRAFTGVDNDYRVSNPKNRNIFSGGIKVVDQLKYVIETLKKDINSRQALITIHDPAKDDFDGDGLKVTKDTPCCRTVQFMVVDGKLNCTLTIRSNDLLWGFSAVNVFNFTWMQQYVANMLGLRIGKYYHFANNMHFYEDKKGLIEIFASSRMKDYESKYGVFQYGDNYTFEKFDEEVDHLFFYEELLRKGNSSITNPTEFLTNYSQFHDWSRVFSKYHNKKDEHFINPYLNDLFYATTK